MKIIRRTLAYGLSGSKGTRWAGHGVNSMTLPSLAILRSMEGVSKWQLSLWVDKLTAVMLFIGTQRRRKAATLCCLFHVAVTSVDITVG